MAPSLPKNIDLQEIQAQVAGQFKDLDPKDPSLWPPLPRYALYFFVIVGVVVALWFTWISTSQTLLEEEQAKEQKLRDDFKVKLAKAVNLDVLKKQREQVQQYVSQLEKQLPSKAEMDALLSDINQAGVGRSLQFDLFRPGQLVVKDYYAELPIALKVSGRYHDIGAFASDIAHLSRIVTLNNLSITPRQDGTLVLDTTAKTFRYLDPDEVAAQTKSKGKGAK
ncbi:MAG: pilus assembly protein PilO [Rhodoferax sp.]|nr:MAG: pilus assembly protein PilO [Rhodoferax sp.]